MHIISLYLIFSMLAVMWFDLTRFKIPNWLVGGVMLAYGAACALQPMPWISGLQAFGLTFAVGYVIFSLRIMGGGDVKLLAACALWVGLSQLLDFISLVATLGGVYALALLIGRKILALLPLKKALPRLMRVGEPIAYGLAIALGFLWMLYKGQLPIAMSAMSAFA
ncbi:MAG: peptidase [Alphaproteobacteria bacterium]|nr:peptidase [Alphaproteobacteria bacterium]